jgi:hypothetical protein
LEYLIDFMHQNDVGVWLIQETWEEGDKFDLDVGGHHVFQHNAPCGENGRQHLFKCIAIILFPLFYKAWKTTGSSPPITLDSQDYFAGRLI